MEYIIAIIIAISLSKMFMGIGNKKPTKLKQVKTVIDNENEKEEVRKYNLSIWERIFGPKNDENIQMYNEYVNSHKDIVKVFYYISDVKKYKFGYKTSFTVYVVNPDNYYGLVLISRIECPESEINSRIRQAVMNRGYNSTIVITKI